MRKLYRHMLTFFMITSLWQIASRITIRGEDKSWCIKSVCRHGKQPHMASAAEELAVANGQVSV